MKTAQTYILIMTLVFTAGCVDPISFETDSEAGQIVIYGNFTQMAVDHSLEISRTVEFGDPTAPVSDACVFVYDNLGNSGEYIETEPGLYVLSPGQIEGIPKRAYHVEIMLGDGTSYFTEPQIMPEPIEMDSLYYEFNPKVILSGSGIPLEKIFIDVLLNTQLNNDVEDFSHLRWSLEEVYSFVDISCGPFDTAETCYFIDPNDENEVLIFEQQSDGQGYIQGFQVRSRELVPYDEFSARHYFIVRQFTINDQEIEFWKKVKAVANQSGSLFDVQPARVVGNILTNGTNQPASLGYFGVNGQSLRRVFTTPFDIRPYPVFDCNDASFFRERPNECCFCFTRQGIQIERPAYWDED